MVLLKKKIKLSKNSVAEIYRKVKLYCGSLLMTFFNQVSYKTRFFSQIGTDNY